jgi:hypothetical protein
MMSSDKGGNRVNVEKGSSLSNLRDGLRQSGGGQSQSGNSSAGNSGSSGTQEKK